MRASAGKRRDRAGHVVFRGIDGSLCAELLRIGEFLICDVDGDHPCTQRGRNLDGGEPDTSAAVHGDPFTGMHLRLIHDAVEGRHEAAPHARGLHEADAIAAINPVIVVEVLSPGTKGVDTGAKLDGYFRVPSIVHYLIVLTARRGVIHHRRAHDGGIDTRILSSGKIELDPPGIAIDIDEIYAR